MEHLSNNKIISFMVFYSFLTFFIGPVITRPFFTHHPDKCIAGFILGFTLSIFLWMRYGRHYISK